MGDASASPCLLSMPSREILSATCQLKIATDSRSINKVRVPSYCMIRVSFAVPLNGFYKYACSLNTSCEDSQSHVTIFTTCCYLLHTVVALFLIE